MAKQRDNGITWTDETWNPSRGCSRVSDGCRNCYAETVAHRFSGPGLAYEGLTRMTSQGPKWTGGVMEVHGVIDQPLLWRRPRRIFVNSMSDLFHENASMEYIARIFAVMSFARQHTFQCLTKRPERMRDTLNSEAFLEAFDSELSIAGAWAEEATNFDPNERYQGDLRTWSHDLPLSNVWLGVSVEDQKTADERIPILLETPAAVRWLSCEPLLGPIDLSSVEWPNKGGHRVDVLAGGYWNVAPYLLGARSARLGEPQGGFTNHSDMNTIDWVVCGSESGANARPMNEQWARSMREHCLAAGVPFFMKQLSGAGGRPIKDMAQFPADLRVQEYPETRT